jgi:quercetin dioxygenase-like cupin family protein
VEEKMKLSIVCVAATLIAAAGLMAPAAGQEGIKRTELGTMDFPPGYQTVMGYAELAKGTCSGRHTHPGIETSYLLEGEGIVKIDGQPDQHLKAGDPIRIPAGVVHQACATAGVKAVTVHVIEKGKPLVSPAP